MGALAQNEGLFAAFASTAPAEPNSKAVRGSNP